MAQYDRPPKKKEKKVDEFVSFFDHLVRYFAVHRIKFISVLAAGVLGFAGYGVYLYWQGKRVEEFATLYAEASRAPAGEALKIWEDLAGKKPPIELDDVISIQMGGIYAKENQWQEAAGKFNMAAQSHAKVLKYLGQWAGAVSLENSGDLEFALGEYKKISEEKENPFKDHGRLGMARSLSALGKDRDAEKILIQLIAVDSEASQGVKSAALNKLLAMKLQKDPSEE